MTDPKTSPRRPRRSRGAWLALLALLWGCLFVPPGAVAQEPRATKLTAKTGSYGLYRGFTAHATLTETRPDAPPSRVVLLFLNEQGEVLKARSDVLSYRHPVSMSINFNQAGGLKGRVAVRLEARVFVEGDGSGNLALLTMERHQSATGSLTTGPDCPIGAEDPGAGGPILPSCGCDVDQEPADEVFPE